MTQIYDQVMWLVKSLPYYSSHVPMWLMCGKFFPIHSLADQLTKAMSLNAGILCMKKADDFVGWVGEEQREDEKFPQKPRREVIYKFI